MQSDAWALRTYVRVHSELLINLHSLTHSPRPTSSWSLILSETLSYISLPSVKNSLTPVSDFDISGHFRDPAKPGCNGRLHGRAARHVAVPIPPTPARITPATPLACNCTSSRAA